MYQRADAQITDPVQLLALMQSHPFATLITLHDGVPAADHLPLLSEWRDGQFIISGHLARANPGWQADSALAIFTGPHAFISADCYDDPDTVPTWNYLAVHAQGPISIIDIDQGVQALLDRLSNRLDLQGRWRQHLSQAVAASFRAAIVAFEIRVMTCRGIAKLSRHQPPERRRRTIAALRSDTQPGAAAIAAAMEETLLS